MNVIVQNLINDPELRQVVQDVFDGAYGNGRNRERRLTEAGYNYDVVQSAVNLAYFYEMRGLKR